jgi:hypothetical protein
MPNRIVLVAVGSDRDDLEALVGPGWATTPMTSDPLAVDPPEFYAGNAVAMEQWVLEAIVAANITAGRDKYKLFDTDGSATTFYAVMATQNLFRIFPPED